MPRRPLEPPTFFVDRCLGRGDVPSALRLAGARVELHDDHFAQDQEDVEWLPIIGQRRWLVLTKDKAIRRRQLEIQALMNAGVGAFILTAGGLDGLAMANTFVAALPRMNGYARTRARPFVAAVTASGGVSIIRGGERLGGIRRR